jgi:hypothetical protein
MGSHHLEFAAEQPRAAGRITGPEVTEGAGRFLRHPDGLEVGEEAARAAQQVFHQPPPRMAAMAAA